MLRLRWRFFWSRRSATRTSLALVLALIALLASLYVVFLANGQRQIMDGLLTAVQGIGALGAEPLLAMAIILCFACSLALIIVPSYRRHKYLATAPSIIPPVSVYLDAENQLSASTIHPFTDFLIKHLNGRRADLLYFLDASETVTTRKYMELYRFGFRPIDVPHDPTGAGAVKEAVDRELAMHAYERALLGPPGQEFIIVTGDADFVPLIYRLVALGHRVQIWASPIREAYRVVERYLGINVIDLSQVVSEIEIAPQPNVAATHHSASKRKRRRKSLPNPPQSSVPLRVAAPPSLTQPGEQQLYYAIAETIAAHTEALRKPRTDTTRNGIFHSLMGSTYSPRMAGVGYSVGNWLDYWLEDLIVLGVLWKVDGHAFPQRGSTTEEEAARSLFALSEAAAKVAASLGAVNENGLVRVREVAAALAAESPAGSPFEGGAVALLKLVTADNGRRSARARYFVRSARALGLLEFEDVPESLDIIAHPRLPATLPTPNEIDTAPDTTPNSPLDPPPLNDNDETV
ncbi:MAG: NYN domain-containing protein [Ktedonobacterales bacterium]